MNLSLPHYSGYRDLAKQHSISNYLVIVTGALILFLPGLGSTHLFDWDEVNFAESSREMLVSGNYAIPQIDFQPFWQKPPLFFWLQALSMKIFGINEFAARLPNVACGVLTLIVLFEIGKKNVNETFGRIWALVYAASLLPQLYFKSGIIDPWFNLFIFLSIYQLAIYQGKEKANRTRPAALSGLFAGLAMLTKGPVALLVIFVCYLIFVMSRRYRPVMKARHILLFVLMATAAGSAWFIALLLSGNGHIIGRFLYYQFHLLTTGDAGHGGPFYYHFIVLLIGCFPASIPAMLAMRRVKHSELLAKLDLVRWMMILFWVVLLLFSIVRTKIVHYSSLCYFPLTFLASLTLYQLQQGKWGLPTATRWTQGLTGLVLGLAIAGLSFIDQWKHWLLSGNLLHDDFARAALQNNGGWQLADSIPGLMLVFSALVFLWLSRRQAAKSTILLFISSLVAFNLSALLVVPKTESYSQRAMIDFMEAKKKENAVVQTIGFKSYAQLFYADRSESASGWLHGTKESYYTAPRMYFVGKINRMDRDRKADPELELLYTKNGFAFYKRRPLATANKTGKPGPG